VLYAQIPPGRRQTVKFTKPALSILDLIQRWCDRGLQIADATEAAQYLQFIGYCRLSAYALPL